MLGPDGLDRPTVCLDDVLCTEELQRRPARPPNYAAENRALTALAETMARAPRAILQELVDTALELCRADSAGISILETDGGREVFRWHAIAGQLAVNAGQGIARDAGACGVVLDRDAVLLFARPERHFTPSVSVDPPAVEALLVPFHSGGKPVGTVWVIAHTEHRQFDAEDARLLESLSRFAAAYQMIGALDAAEAGRAELERQVAEHTRELSDANQTLWESQERLQVALSAARMGIWTWDVATDTLTLDANLNRLFGLEPMETKQPLGEFLERIHLDDRAVVAAAFDACAQRGCPLNVEFRVVRPDGAVCWLRHQGAPPAGLRVVTLTWLGRAWTSPT
jgi:PAS domain-containing protein